MWDVIPRAIAVTVLTLAATLSLPATATAAEYPPDDQAGVATTACTGQFVAEAGYFEPGETVTITVSGTNANAVTLAPAVLRAQSLPTFTAGDDGSLVVDIMNGASARGDFELTTTGTESPARGPILFSLTASCTPAADGALPFADGDDGLPSTGTDLTPVWIGGGMLVLGALALGGVYVVRRRRA